MSAFGLLGFPETQVPVPERIGTSRDWEEPSNADLFVPIDASEDSGRGETVYTQLGKQTYGR